MATSVPGLGPDAAKRMKVFGLIPLIAGWTPERWRGHYRERHGPLVASTPSFARHFLAYAQNDVFEELSPAVRRGPPIVGISELWFSEPSELQAAFAEPDYGTHIRPDEERFTAAAKVRGGVGTETVIVDASPDCGGPQRSESLHKLFVLHPSGGGEGGVQSTSTFVEQAKADAESQLQPDLLRLTLTLPDAAVGAFADGVAAIEEYLFPTRAAAAACWSRIAARPYGRFGTRASACEALIARHRTIFTNSGD